MNVSLEGKRHPQASILILSDAPSDGVNLINALQSVGFCECVSLRQLSALPSPLSLIVCDIAFDDLTSIDLLQNLLAGMQEKTVPVLCLLRDPSHLSETYARSIGATAVLPRLTMPFELARLAQSLVTFNADSLPRREKELTQADVREAERTLLSIFDAGRRSQPVSTPALLQGGRAVLNAVRGARVRAWLDIVWRYDDTTYQHCLLVAGLATGFAVRLGLTHRHQLLIAQAALVHDIGKARIPLAILNKPGKLTAPEMMIMKTHASIGHDLLVRQHGFNQDVLDIVRHHHELLDGSGYPDGLRGEQISSFVRMTTICDIYAALIERRPYKAPMPSQQAYSILANMHGKLDASLLQAFEAVIAPN